MDDRVNNRPNTRTECLNIRTAKYEAAREGRSRWRRGQYAETKPGSGGESSDVGPCDEAKIVIRGDRSMIVCLAI